MVFAPESRKKADMQLIDMTNIYVQTKANVIRPSADGQQLTDDLPPKPTAAADGHGLAREQ